MVPIRVKDVVRATGGRLLCGDAECLVTEVVTDSRQVKEGSLFVPIIGERVDAHRFIPNVMKAGAAASFTSEDDRATERGACIYVDDTLAALQKLAGWYRRQFDIPVIGVTGSVGKTTTKEMISAVLETKYRVLKTAGNLNSQIGVALMMFHIDEQTELAVFEMGISMPGEMSRLVEIARPQTAVMTNIGVSHIGNLGSRAAIAFEKGHIVKYVGDGYGRGEGKGKLYVCGNGDLQLLSKENIPFGDAVCGDCSSLSDEIVFYGTDEGCRVMATDLCVTGQGQRFRYCGEGSCEVHLSVMGAHHVCNALVALALGEQFGVELDAAAEALRCYRPFTMRGERKDCHGYHVIDDTYNASPDSINSNIDALFDYGETGRRIVVLGDVLELGEQRESLHRGIGDFILAEAEKGKKLYAVITVGEGAAFIAEQVKAHSDMLVETCAGTEEAAQLVRQLARPGDWILVKGSRGMHMDEVVEKVVM